MSQGGDDMKAFVRSHAVLLVLTGIYAANFMDRSAVAVVIEPMKADLGLSDGEAGLVQSILLLCLPLLVIPCALSLDLWSRRKMIFLVAMIWGLGVLSTGLAVGFATLLVARAVCSLGESTFGAGSTAWISMTYPAERRASMLGFFALSAPLGMALGTLSGGLLFSATGTWRSPFFLVAGLGLALGACVPLLKDYAAPAAADFKTYGRASLGLLRNRTLILVSLATAAFGYVKFSYQGWVPALLVRSYELDSMTAGLLFTAMVLAGALGPVIGGRIADLAQRRSGIGRPLSITGFMALIVVSKSAFYGLMGVLPLPALVVLGILDGIITMAPVPVYFSIVQDVVPVRLKSMSVGVFGVIVFLTGAAWGPIAVGALSDALGGGASGLRLAMLSNVAVGIAGVLLYAACCRSYMADKAGATDPGPVPAPTPVPA